MDSLGYGFCGKSVGQKGGAMGRYVMMAALWMGMCCAITVEEAHKIGEKIWKNECGGKIEGLTCWNKGENFPSLGIGHFIWYGEKREGFEETFPELVAFLSGKGVKVPEWMKGASPWQTREAFYAAIDSNKMKELRKMLLETKHLQAEFIAERLDKTIPILIEKCAKEDRERVKLLYTRIAKDAAGVYALIDYLNFKGSGMSEKERYKGKGWGLLQVLLRMKVETKKPLEEFVGAAKVVLKERVENAPIERGEEKWLKGWHNRLDTYISF